MSQEPGGGDWVFAPIQILKLLIYPLKMNLVEVSDSDYDVKK